MKGCGVSGRQPAWGSAGPSAGVARLPLDKEEVVLLVPAVGSLPRQR